MAATGELLINGVNTRTADGFRVTARPVIRGGPVRSTPQALIPGLGPVALNSRSTIRLKVWTVTGQIRGDDVADVQAKIDRLKGRARSREEATLAFTDMTDRQWFGRFMDLVTSPPRLENPDTWMPLTLSFELFRPYAYSDYLQVDLIGATGTQIPLGTEETHDIILRITGQLSDPVIEIRDQNNLLRQRLSLRVNLPVSEWIDINMRDGLIIDQNGVDQSARRLPDSTWPIILRPRDGDPYATPPAWPTLSINSGTMRCTYRRAW